MARKRRYGSAIGGDDITESPYLESINLPDENYYRNMTESPMELDQPHISTNPIKHGLSRANVSNTMIIQDKYNQTLGERVLPKVRRKRTLIPKEAAHERNDTDYFRRALHDEDVDIFQDDLSLRNNQTSHTVMNLSNNTFMYNTRSKAISTRQENVNVLGKSAENSLRKRTEKKSSNLPPLPRTEDYWPKINRDTTQDHEEYLNSIRDQHFNRSKENEGMMRNVSNNMKSNSQPDQYQSNSYNVSEGIYSIETPLKSFRSKMTIRPVNNDRLMHARSSGKANIGFGEYDCQDKYSHYRHFGDGDVIGEGVRTAGGYLSSSKSSLEKSVSTQSLPIQKQAHHKGGVLKVHCDAMVGGDTPLRDISFREDSKSDSIADLTEVKTNEIGVGPSPKIDIGVKMKEGGGSGRMEVTRQRITGSILRKSIDVSEDNSKQVRFSSKKSKAKQNEEKFPEVEELRFDPGEIPLIDYNEYEDRFDTIDFDQGNASNIKIDENKMLDTMSVDNNICLRLVQLSKEEIKLFEKAILSQKDQGAQDGSSSSCTSMDDELMIKAVSGIHKYFLTKAFEFESGKDLELRDVISLAQEVKYNEDRHQSINSERDELISKIGVLNLNINRLANALQEAEELNSRLFPPPEDDEIQEDGNKRHVQSGGLQYIFKCTSILLDEFESTKAGNAFGSPKTLANSEKDGGDHRSSDVDKSDTSYLCSPTPVMPFEEGNAELGSSTNQEHSKTDLDIDELLNECHQSQFIQMESIAVLNDCMSLLDDAEVGMQNFQRLLAKKAFDTNEETEQSHIGYNSSNGDSMEVVEDTLLRLQRGVSVTPRFSLEGSISNYRTSVGSRKSIGGKA